MKQIIGLSFTVLLFCCNQKVGGKCNYETFQEQVSVSEIEMKGDEIEFVTLSGGDASSVYSYKLTSEDLKKFSEINFQQIKENTQSLEITIEKITNRTCVPFVITEIKPKQ